MNKGRIKEIYIQFQSGAPLNQEDSIAPLATPKLSPPKPYSTRPQNIRPQDFEHNPRVKKTCPSSIKKTNHDKQIFNPKRSTKYPPKKGNIKLGTLYTEYNSEKNNSKFFGVEYNALVMKSSSCVWREAGMS